MLASGVFQKIPSLLFLSSALLVAGCQSTPQKVEPRFGLETMTLVGSLKFDHGSDSVVGDVVIRYQEPQQFEMLVTKGPTITICHVLADKDNWHIEFPLQHHALSGQGTPGAEELALWVESRKLVAEAIKRAQFADPFTETMRGSYQSGRTFQMELGDFRKIVGEVMATRMTLSCRGCKSSLEIVVHDLR